MSDHEVEYLCLAYAENMLLSWDIHPDPCPSFGTRNLEPGTWVCCNCGRERMPEEMP